MYWLIPNIEKETALFRALWGMIFADGIGRLILMLTVAMPPAPFVGFTVLEIVGAPILAFWRAQVAKKLTRTAS